MGIGGLPASASSPETVNPIRSRDVDGGAEVVWRGDGECPGEGDCCEDNGTPSCNDPACCNSVCLVDPFCCDEEWDQICADLAVDMCLLCGAGEPCSTPALCDGDVNGDGVLDPLDTGYILARLGADLCAEGNCQADVNCDGLIDPLDLGYVLARFGVCNPPAACNVLCLPGNNDCEDAFVIEDGLTPFSTIGATTDGPITPKICGCDPGFGCGGYSDVWYDYTATCDGYGVVSTCNDDDPATGEADFDTWLHAYEGCDCPADNDYLVGCNDDGPECSGFSSIMWFPVTEGSCYLVRVSGFGGSGTGVLAVSCED